MAQNEKELPISVDGEARVRYFEGLELEKTSRLAAAYAKVSESVEFRLCGQGVQVIQNDREIGMITRSEVVRLFMEWDKTGDPILATLVSYSFTGTAARINLAFYRNELERLRKKKGAIISRISYPETWIDEDYIGRSMHVWLDDETGRYVLMIDDLEAGMLPQFAVDQIRANSYEPDELCYFLDHREYDKDVERVNWYVLIV